MINRHITTILNNFNKYPLSDNFEGDYYPTQSLYINTILNEEDQLLNNMAMRKNARRIALQFEDLVPKIHDKSESLSALLKKYESLEEEARTLDERYGRFALQYGLSVKSLIFYKKKEYTQARELIFETIEHIDIFVEQGFYSLLFRAAEMNRNLSYIDFRENVSGPNITASLVDYYLNKKCSNLIGNCFNEIVWNENAYLREWFGYHLLLEMIKKIYEKSNTENLVNGINPFLNIAPIEPLCYERNMLNNFLLCQNHFYKRDYNDFLRLSNNVLKEETLPFFAPIRGVLLRQIQSLARINGYNKIKLLTRETSDFLKNNVDKYISIKTLHAKGVAQKT